jgi:predicted transcriptional regulator
LEEDEGVEKLHFEFASDVRLGILQELQSNRLKMQEVARRQDLTTTEAVRQLKRLSDASLVERRPEGSYAVTQYGKLVLQLSSSLDFVHAHRRYFLTHDVWRIPRQFVDRLGDLSQTTLKADTMESINMAERIVGEAKQYIWGIGEGRFTEATRGVGAAQASRGTEGRFLTPLPAQRSQSFENRTLSEIPVIVTLTEREAEVCFRLVEGRMDYAGFFGKDPVFLGWVRDLFLYYWDRGKRS